MMNIYTCVCENKTSVQYGVPSPSVDEYLGVSRQDCYDGNDADQNMIQLGTFTKQLVNSNTVFKFI